MKKNGFAMLAVLGVISIVTITLGTTHALIGKPVPVEKTQVESK